MIPRSQGSTHAHQSVPLQGRLRPHHDWHTSFNKQTQIADDKYCTNQTVLVSRYVIFLRQRAGDFGLVLNVAENTGGSSSVGHCSANSASTAKSKRPGSGQRAARLWPVARFCPNPHVECAGSSRCQCFCLRRRSEKSRVAANYFSKTAQWQSAAEYKYTPAAGTRLCVVHVSNGLYCALVSRAVLFILTFLFILFIF